LGAGGARRTKLRGLANLNKRFQMTAAIDNLSQLMRKLLGVGTPQQWVAGVEALAGILCRLLTEGWSRFTGVTARWIAGFNCGWEPSRPPLAARVKNLAAGFFRVPFLNPKKAIS
jgi:hypothetical protein